MSARPIPEPIAPGQESVWDYPLPPVVRASDEEIIVILGGMEICETRTSLRMLERGHPPTYYLPRSAFIEGSLRPARGTSFCEWKGQAAYLDVIGGSKVAARGAWYYPHPSTRYASILDHVGIYAGAMDECLVDGVRVVPQPGGYYGGWITSTVTGPFKGGPGTEDW
ncbi:MAG TPA: DUF427 domain-containing protein [Propionibacteriaceae bacterium]